MKTKRFTFGVAWQMYGTQSIEVPEGFTIDEAVEYVLDIWQDIALPRGDYVADSDELDFDNCRFLD